jgi:hypothetical protein
LNKHQQEFWIIDSELTIEDETERKQEAETYKIEDGNTVELEDISKRKAKTELIFETKRLKTTSVMKNEDPSYDPDCYECKQIFRDPPKKDLIMYLHALSYRV